MEKDLRQQQVLTQKSPTERQNVPLENSESTPSVSEQKSVLSDVYNATLGLVLSISGVFSDDSLPKRRGMVSIQTDDCDGKAVKFKAKDGEISELEIDGKAIPKEDFGKYRNFTENFLASLPMPPPPPSAPPSGGWNLPTPLTPPPSDWNVLPQPAPPVPPLYFKKTKDAQGNTIIKMTKRDGKISEIKITQEKEVFLNGKKVEDGDDVHLNLGDTEGVIFN